MKWYRIEGEQLVSCGQGKAALFVGTPEELKAAGNAFSPHTYFECANEGPTKLEAYENYSFLTLNLPDKNVPHKTARVGIYVSRELLCMVSAVPVSEVDETLCFLEKEKTPGLSSLSVLYHFLTRLTAEGAKTLSGLEDEIDQLDEQVMEMTNTDSSTVQRISDLRRKLRFYKKYLEQLLDVAEGIEENANNVFSGPARHLLCMFTDRVNRLCRNVQSLLDYVAQVRESYQSQVDISLNRVMKLFTVITAVFLPLSLIAGWYGMNFTGMPELSWKFGYLYVAGLSVFIVVACLWFFKKKKML